MDVALTNSIVATATNLASAQTSDALNMAVLKKALDVQASSAATMIDAMQQSMPQRALATPGTLGTQVNTFASETAQLVGRARPAPPSTQSGWRKPLRLNAFSLQFGA